MTVLPAGLKEIDPIGYVGIDFGTSNSHFAYCDVKALQAEPIRLGGASSQATCVLWKRPCLGENEVVAYGTQALQEWSVLNEDERALHVLAAGFKPDLVASEAARRSALAFLRKAYLEMTEGGLVKGIGATAGVPVVIGVPAEIGEEHVAVTGQLAREAGFGSVTCVAEPLGALAYHLANNDLNLQAAREGVVVVDFGGGTLDVAVVDDTGLRQPWGEPLLGGRLFDDLFYQWLLDQSPGLTVKPHDWLYVWTSSCRALKEAFSRHWAQMGPGSKFQFMVPLVDRLVPFKNATVAEFERRAQHYQPSREARAHFHEVGGDLAQLGLSPINLFEWARAVLNAGASGLTFRRVLLTGGSSDWPFMRPLAAEAFGVRPENVLRSKQPELTIGSGLALYHALQRRLEKTRHLLRGHKPTRRQQFEQALDERLDNFVTEVPQAALAPLMAEVEPLFLNWYNEGGSLDEVEKQVEQVCQAAGPALDALLKREAELLGRDVLALMRHHLRQWLAEHAIERDVNAFLPAELGDAVKGAGVGQGVTGQVAEPLALAFSGALAALVVTVTLVLKAAILGTMLPLLLNPIGIVIGLIGAAAAVVGLGGAHHIIKAHRWGNWPFKGDLRAMWAVLSEARLRQKLAESKDAATAQLSSDLRQALAAMRRQAVEQFDRVIDEVIDDLRVLEQLRGRGA